MSEERNASFLPRLWRRAGRLLGRWWNCKEYVIYYKSLVAVPQDKGNFRGRVRFFVATEEDIPWMSQYLGEWAKWCYGGKEVSGVEPVLREQFTGEDFTVVGAEDEPDGALVFVMHLSRDDEALRLLGDAFCPAHDLSCRRGWVCPDHRRQGIADAGLRFAEAEAARRGLKNMWNFVIVGNIASRGMHRKLGYEDRGRARCLTRLKRRYAAIRLDPATRWRTRRIPFSITHL